MQCLHLHAQAQVQGRDYWDNGDSKNYRVRVCQQPGSVPCTPDRGAPMACPYSFAMTHGSAFASKGATDFA